MKPIQKPVESHPDGDLNLDQQVTENMTTRSVEVKERPPVHPERYVKEKILGKGGMGEVFSAYDTLLCRHVAVKSILKPVLTDSVEWKRFYREAQITAQLAHPSIVPVYEMQFTQSQQPSLVMKEIRGLTLSNFMKLCTKVENTDKYIEAVHGLLAKIDIIVKVCDALHYAHSRGVVHRDIKPPNIMVGPFEDVYVMDWGVARVIDEDLDALNSTIEIADLGLNTQQGVIVGTFRYMPPEQARGEIQNTDYPADQFTVGMVLYEMLTGVPARKGKTPQELLDMAKKDIVGTAQWKEDLQGVDPKLVSILGKALAFSADDRYFSMKEFAQDLRYFVQDKPVSTYSESMSMQVERYFRKHPHALLSAFIFLIFLATLSSIYALQSSLEAEKRLEMHKERAIQMLNSVGKYSTKLDSFIVDIQQRLQELSAVAHTELKYPTTEDSCLRYSDLTKQDHAFQHILYKNNFISVLEPVCVLAKGVSVEDASMGLSVASRMKEDIMQAFVGGDTDSVQRFQADFINQTERTPVQAIYMGFADGTLFHYPGIAQFGDNYDPRLRPWYTQGIAQNHVACGDPYQDASGLGYVLPCFRQILDTDQKPVGVVSTDFLVDHLIDIMQSIPVDTIKHSYLLDDKGYVLFSDRDWGVLQTDTSASSEKKIFFREEVVEDVVAQKDKGIKENDSRIYVYSRLQFVPWTLVYEFSSDVWECDGCITQ